MSNVLEQALEALLELKRSYEFTKPSGYPKSDSEKQADKAIYALKEAIKRQGEPVAKIIRNDAGQIHMIGADGNSFNMSKFVGESFYTSAQTMPEDMAKDAERYRWIRENGDEIINPDRGLGPEWVYGCELDAEIDAAILSAAPKGE